MREGQEKAIKSLERAMKKMRDSGLALIGVDSDLIAVSYEDYASNSGSLMAIGDTLNEIEYHVVDCLYIDSCAT